MTIFHPWGRTIGITMRIINATLATILASLGLAACSNTPVNSFDNMTISSGNDGVWSAPVNLNYPLQTRFLSINGQLPLPSIGSGCMASSYRPASSFICFSNGPTSVLTRNFTSNASLSDLNAIKGQLQSLSSKLAAITASTATEDNESVSAAEVTVTREFISLVQDAAKENVFIFRWNSSKDGQVSAGAGSVAGAQASTASATSGLVIVAGLRVSQLLVGPSDFKATFGYLPEDAKIATLTMSTKRLLYFADENSSAAFASQLQASIDEAESLSPQTKLSLGLLARLAAAQENQGSFSAPTGESQTLAEAAKTLENEQVFYATMTDLKTLRKSLPQ